MRGARVRREQVFQLAAAKLLVDGKAHHFILLLNADACGISLYFSLLHRTKKFFFDVVP
jgi:hypothetical protein